jgi:catechol 2,3 dioxygenase
MAETADTRFEIAQLAHVELLTPIAGETLSFFHDILGMEISARQGQSVYLRAYEDHYHHTLKLTEAKEPGLGHVAWRTTSDGALERRAAALAAAGCGLGWIDSDAGHGRAYRFATPDGHAMELFWEVEYFEAPAEERTRLLNRPQRRPSRGVPVRRLDHANLLASDVRATTELMTSVLGFRLNELMRRNGSEWLASFVAVTNLAHDLAVFADPTGSRGRLHHIAYWYGFPQHLYDAAELMKEHEIVIEAGPGRHGITQGMFLYAYEPGGNRVELFGDSGYLIFDPDWKTVVWEFEEAIGYGDAWVGQVIPEIFYLYGTPVVEPPPVA